MLLRLFAAACLVASPATARLRTADGAIPAEEGADPYATPVFRTVASIVEYSRWPQERAAIRLCLAGATQHTAHLAERPQEDSRVLRPLSIDSPAEIAGRCDALYLGTMPLEDQRRFTSEAYDHPILTIIENDPACQSGAMVCLLFETDGVAFRINTDAIARSQVRVDPRVLRMSSRRNSA